ncbi:MAG: hypothetical protein JJV88_01535 [Sulfurovum sp.]|nr:hypothetical protein [Sulfurovaceae bacterium]
MTSNFSEFMRETMGQVEEQKLEQKRQARQIILETYQFIVNGSAVNTGLYKHNHQVSINSKRTETVEINENIQAQNRLEINSASLNNNHKLTIQNRLNYANKLEAGHSRQQAPALYGRAEEKARTALNRRNLI